MVPRFPTLVGEPGTVPKPGTERSLCGPPIRGAQTPAGFYPISALFPLVTVAGSALHCAACGAEGTTGVLPKDVAAYNAACEAWLRQHKHDDQVVRRSA